MGTGAKEAFPQRIVSLLPGATEMVASLGLEDRLVGISHACDFPPTVRTRPVVVRPRLDTRGMDPGDVDRWVSAELGQGNSLYEVDEQALAGLRPDLILTQDLCEVCAASSGDLLPALRSLSPRPTVLTQNPHRLPEVLDALGELGRRTGREGLAEELLRTARARLSRVQQQVCNLPVRRVVFLEWLDPVYGSGHWVPDMVDLAGGQDPLGRRGIPSVRIPWTKVVEARPEVLLLGPCSVPVPEVVRQAAALLDREGFDALPAVRQGEVYAVDARSYFACPGPRLVDGVELLGHLLHPEAVTWTGAKDAYVRLRPAEEAGRPPR
jgi:iron complex transport system substrate-binding protein